MSPQPLTRGASLASRGSFVLKSSVILLTLLLSSGCREKDVVAEVGDTELRRADLAEFASRRSRALGGDAAAALEALIARARLAEQADELDLDERPEVLVRLAAARREVLAQALLEERLRDVTSERAIRQRYEETKVALTRRELKVRHVMVRLDPAATEADKERARNKANLLYARIVGGEAFEAVAREASEDELSAPKGGDLGLVREGQVHPSFFDAVAGLRQGEVSKPFETPFGVHVAQAQSPVEKVVPSFEEARGVLAAEARAEAEAALTRELEKEVSVKRFPEALRAKSPPAAPAEGTAAHGG